MQGVLDRIEDGMAVILIETRGIEITVPESYLPAGSIAGTWFDIELDEHNQIVSCLINETLTEEKKDKVSDLQQQLQKRKKKSKFKRNKD